MEKYGRGQHPNSKANLVGNQKPFTSENGSERQALGVEAKAKNKLMKDLLSMALDQVVVNASGDKKSKREVTAIQLANEMAKGNLKAVRLGLQILGELQEKVDITSSDNTLQIEIVPSRRENKGE